MLAPSLFFLLEYSFKRTKSEKLLWCGNPPHLKRVFSSIAPFLNHPALLANFTETLPTLMFGIPRPKHTQRDDAVVRMIKG